MSLYEAAFIVRQEISQSDVEKLADKYINIVQDNGGKVLKREYWGLRNLAYQINKNRKGHYVMLAVDAAPAVINEMERNLGLDEDVIRNETYRVDAIEKGPSMMVQQSSTVGMKSEDLTGAPLKKATEHAEPAQEAKVEEVPAGAAPVEAIPAEVEAEKMIQENK